MNYNKLLGELVKQVKENAQQAGTHLTQAQMAASLGIGRTYLSNMIGGKAVVTAKFIAFFKDIYRQYLPESSEVTPDDVIILSTAIGAVMRAIAKLQTRLPNGVDAANYLSELKLEIELISTQRKVADTSLRRTLEQI